MTEKFTVHTAGQGQPERPQVGSEITVIGKETGKQAHSTQSGKLVAGSRAQWCEWLGRASSHTLDATLHLHVWRKIKNLVIPRVRENNCPQGLPKLLGAFSVATLGIIATLSS